MFSDSDLANQVPYLRRSFNELSVEPRPIVLKYVEPGSGEPLAADDRTSAQCATVVVEEVDYAISQFGWDENHLDKVRVECVGRVRKQTFVSSVSTRRATKSRGYKDRQWLEV